MKSFDFMDFFCIFAKSPNMRTKKLTDLEFLELVIDKELEIANADTRYKDIMSLPIEERKKFDFYNRYSFKTVEQFIEWRQFFYDHFYDWQPKYRSKASMKQEFSYWNLQWGLTCDFPVEQITEYDKKVKNDK